jgi:hypothetical protein
MIAAPSRRAAVVLVALALVVAACGDDEGGATDSADSGWPSFTDPTMGIGFRMPDDPETLTQRVQLPDGTPSEIVVHTYGDDDWELFVSAFPLDPATFDLDGAAPGAAAAVNGDVVDVRQVTVADRPGRDAEIAFRVDGQDRLLLYRAILLDGGLVQLQTIGAESDRARIEQRHADLVAGFSAP